MESTHILLDEVQAAIIGHEGSNFLSVLDKLDTCALTNGRVRLLGLNTTAQKYNNSSEWE